MLRTKTGTGNSRMSDALDAIIRERLAKARDIVIIAHVRPDGDAVGSLLGLGNGLINAGKRVQMVLEDGMPQKYMGLKNSTLVTRKIIGDYDTCIIVDSSDPARVGSVLDGHPQPDICIDHHKTNLNFAKINLVEDEAVATAAILAARMPNWKLDIDQAVASCLLTGIIADTIGFRTSNMGSEALRISAELIDKGADLPTLYRQALVSQPVSAIRYWGAGLNRLEYEKNDIVWTSLRLDDRIKCGYDDNDDADLINILSTVEGIRIAIIFIEQPDGRVKVSWRSHGETDVSNLAFSFGGGGHKAAAGADIKGEFSEVVADVLSASRALLSEPDTRKQTKNI